MHCTTTFTILPHNRSISVSWTWYPSCLRKQTCLALLTSAASQLCTTMKLRVASCNLTHWCWIVERKCDSRGNRINSEPFSSSCTRVTYRFYLYFFFGYISSSLLSTVSPSFFPLILLCCHSVMHGGCTPFSLGPYTRKRLVTQPPGPTHAKNTNMYTISSTCIRTRIPPPLRPFTPSQKLQLVLNGGSGATAFCSAAEIMCIFPLLTPNLESSSAQEPSAL